MNKKSVYSSDVIGCLVVAQLLEWDLSRLYLFAFSWPRRSIPAGLMITSFPRWPCNLRDSTHHLDLTLPELRSALHAQLEHVTLNSET